MGFDNPVIPWRELERRLSDRTGTPPWSNGSRRSDRASSNGAGVVRSLSGHQAGRGSGLPRVPYAELHARSRFSFMDGSSNPEDLVAEAVRLELDALAITDRDGFYGVVRFAEAAEEAGLPTVFGAELTLGLPGSPRRSASAGPAVRREQGRSVVVLARDPAGYAALGTLISEAHMAGRKGEPRLSTEMFLEAAAAHRDRWAILTGAHDGAVPSALVEHGPRAAAAALDRLIDAAGASNVYVELWDHSDPLDGHRNDALAELGVRRGVQPVCANAVRYATPGDRRLADALAAVGDRRSLDDHDGWLGAWGGAHVRSGAEQARRFARYPGAVEAAARLGSECAFSLSLVAPELPPYPCPDGLDEAALLRRLATEGALARYGSPEAERVPGAWRQVEHELDMIEQLGFCGYFLVVWDIASFCRSRDIYCQGRGSAANSVVCYVLGITNVDSVALDLLFERFLSPERDGPPDIDIDIESDRREEVIQYVYGRYGRDRTALVANVIAYRARSAVRDMARALGHPPARQDTWAKSLDRRGGLGTGGGEGDPAEGAGIPADVLALAAEAEGGPRHLGIHPGGMVICDRPIAEVCPVEWASMADRSVLQWDKDDCAVAGLVKFDLLGLGMLSALHYAVDLVASAHGERIDLAALPQDPAVYDMLCEADSVGVFQVESRAQMATLPRLRPRCFYDLVVEVALIRPGPIQGGSVHPYIRRRNGVEPVTYLHPLLERSLAKTLGVPLFQEQLMQMAIDVAGFTPAESDELRRAMGAKRSVERMERLRGRFFAGMAERGIGAEAGEQIWHKMVAFATYGFPESHSVSFSYLVYASAWIKLHYPAAFCAALLNAQPMGFYSPHSLCQDARRHGVAVLGPDVNRSAGAAVLETCEESTGGVAVRLGLSSVRGVGPELADDIAAGAPYDSMEHLVRAMSLERPLDLPVLEALTAAGAFDSLGLDRREALWAAGAAAQSGASRLPGAVTGTRVPKLRSMSPQEQSAADLWTTGVAPDGHPTRFHRSELDAAGVVTAADLLTCPVGRVKVAGTVSHRQRPMTAGGTMFINLEDETGFVNVIVSKGCQARFRKTVLMSRALMVRGRLERHEGAVNVIAEHLAYLSLPATLPSRDFR
ncbi:MAG: error-prone DNA polymerase [Acidimicrobiaceae bacterium]|nr:error-prone DNA polymerase [Acidimicrobiaceae bacterium]MYB87822.1 error-prone DNA polymerase [Acidimicrobiaceae bacterium]